MNLIQHIAEILALASARRFQHLRPRVPARMCTMNKVIAGLQDCRLIAASLASRHKLS